MIHLGDITKIDGSKILPVDVIIGGSPCQDLSIAGKREGLSGERSGLFMEQIRIIKEMHKKYGTTYPRFMVWENVPGALSSNKGEDFRIVLEKTAKISEPDAIIPRPSKGKWKNSGCIMGDGWSIAWRIFNAQFWGVPQRRRRIALVADFGGESAPEILFERKGVSGDFEEGRTPWKGTSNDAERSSETADNENGIVEGLVYDCRGNGDRYINPTLTGDYQNRVTDYTAVCIQGNCIDRSDTAGCNGKGCKADIAYTLNTVDRHAVAYPVIPINTMIATRHKQLGERTGLGIGKESDPQSTILAGHKHAVAYATHGHSPIKPVTLQGEEVAGTIMSRDNKGVGRIDTLSRIICEFKSNSYIVRRLTSLECERLQGFPDGWTDIGDYTDSKGKKKKSSDTARYKALGNSIALPPWRWVLIRLCSQYKTPATMGSLFDGIGGFPLIWEKINGKGSCLWASEIEEFPIAVTKIRFSQ